MLPLPSLVHGDVVTGLRNLRVKLLQQAPPISTWSSSINSNTVLNDMGGAMDCLATTPATETDSVGVDIDIDIFTYSILSKGIVPPTPRCC
uniref:Uncharacterized protein n=1 Tax=Physcomitrium patens TaxID=3218 RepID=A0A2K1J2Y0_PHYPA|nr:hypothetical protein PHYPA_021735 [Physcomitrium patens]